MLDRYCDAVDKLKYVGEVAGCRVTVYYHNYMEYDYTVVALAFCDPSRQPLKLNDSNYVVRIGTCSLDTKFFAIYERAF